MPKVTQLLRRAEICIQALSCSRACQHGLILLDSSSRLQTANTWQRAERESRWPYDCYKGTDPIHEGSILMTSSDPNYLL